MKLKKGDKVIIKATGQIARIGDIKKNLIFYKNGMRFKKSTPKRFILIDDNGKRIARNKKSKRFYINHI